jgi:ABC-2 type transport system permease protein
MTGMFLSLQQSLQRILAITMKELRQLMRDRPTFGMVVGLPLVQLLLFGYAINTNVRDLPVGVVDLSHTQVARTLISDLNASQVIKFTRTYQTPREGEDAIRKGDVYAVLVIPVDIGQRLQDDRPIAQWIVDGSDSMVSSTMLALQQMPFNSGFAVQTSARKNTFEMALLFNPERRAAVNIVPGLVAIVLTMTMVMFTSAALVRERERGNLELLITTPVRSSEIMLGKILPYIGVGLIQVVIILGLGHFIFNVPINGPLDQLVLAVFAFISASLTLGLLVSTLAKNQLQAMQLTIFLLMPSILLSGFVFPYEGMPRAAQWIAEALPATHFIRMIRAIVLRGATLEDLQPDLLWLIGFTILGIIAAASRFKKKLD